ncbi:hypothetical protein K503DRAFT_493657 [Rhizopogon vinicolor AM-OR11-026]|uniref:Uncharacterized protein n=1 Tax=Rhizopogon vinicolor AM-OR11-026 TaxID=1314800 RepID=A0A1B7N9B1_9AGAM|nr:hypothetical protein K503DRAFT_493657 [Rhizopogon vinicolor AM-OR11-026]
MSQVCGPWRSFIARRPCPQGVSAVCMGSGSCTVSIFSCPITATLAGWASHFLLIRHPNPNPSVQRKGFCVIVNSTSNNSIIRVHSSFELDAQQRNSPAGLKRELILMPSF